MDIENEICRIAEKTNFAARSEKVPELLGGNPVRKWWFADADNNPVSPENGMTDVETLHWLAGENVNEIHRLRELLQEIDEDED